MEITTPFCLSRAENNFAAKGNSKTLEVAPMGFDPRAVTFTVDIDVIKMTVSGGSEGPETSGEAGCDEDRSCTVEDVTVTPLSAGVG